MSFLRKLKIVFKPKGERPLLPAFKSIIHAVAEKDLIGDGTLINSYEVSGCKIYIVDAGGEGLYIVDEPPVSDDILKAYTLIKEHIEEAIEPTKVVNVHKFIEDTIWGAATMLGILKIVTQHFDVLKYYLTRDIFGYGPIHIPMIDPKVEEVKVEGPNIPVAVVHRDISHYYWLNTNIEFTDPLDLQDFVMRLAAKSGIVLSTAFPVAEGRSPEGHRITVSLGEISGRGSSFVIRKFPREPLTMPFLIANNTFSPLMAAYMWLIVESLGSFLIIGAMASGKTTTLQSIMTLAPPDFSITTIEDTPELRFPHTHWDPLYTRHTYSIGTEALEIGLFDLVKASLRRRGQYVIVGEVRGEEAYNLVQSIATGSGGACTFHASDIESALMRLTSPPINIQPSFMALIWCVILMKRVQRPDGRFVRRVANIWEIEPKWDPVKGIRYREIFSWDAITDKFYPETPEELLKKSVRMREVMYVKGLRESNLIEELKRRMSFLIECVEDEIFKYDEFVKRLKGFYKNFRTITITTNNLNGNKDKGKSRNNEEVDSAYDYFISIT